MKFKKDGKVFEDLSLIALDFCMKINCYYDFCPIAIPCGALACGDWIKANPAEAARLMGYEVVDEDIHSDTYNAVRESCNQWPGWKREIYNANLSAHAKPLEKEVNMDKQKPIKDWTLGEAHGYCKEHTSCHGCRLMNYERASCKLAGPASRMSFPNGQDKNRKTQLSSVIYQLGEVWPQGRGTLPETRHRLLHQGEFEEGNGWCLINTKSSI